MSAENPEVIDVAISGAAGQIGSLVGKDILSSGVFGEATVNLHLLEVTAATKRAEGVAMELEDMGFPNLGGIEIEDDPNRAFRDVNFAFLVGARPRGADMERADLLAANGPIFVDQGGALASYAAEDVRALVVGNPANSNALVAIDAAGPDIPPDRITAMSRLDHNRAVASLARRLGVKPDEIDGLVVWGNHSKTMVPDLTHVTVKGEPLPEALISDSDFYNDFVDEVARRGDAVIQARGASSAMSAAKAATDNAKDWLQGTDGRWTSMAVQSRGQYGVPEGVVASFPVTTEPGGELTVVEGLELLPHVMDRIAASGKELAAERETLRNLGLVAVS